MSQILRKVNKCVAEPMCGPVWRLASFSPLLPSIPPSLSPAVHTPLCPLWISVPGSQTLELPPLDDEGAPLRVSTLLPSCLGLGRHYACSPQSVSLINLAFAIISPKQICMRTLCASICSSSFSFFVLPSAVARCVCAWPATCVRECLRAYEAVGAIGKRRTTLLIPDRKLLV